ncbi:MAG: DUF3703 domain-containing protein, partial [Rhodocyclaceae bacterium]|nr:DUF3703 domain-containing protein [Rhodocyclaceae bacterium]
MVSRQATVTKSVTKFFNTKESIVNDVYSREISLAQDALIGRDHVACFTHLERAHVLAQRRTLR